MEKTDKIYVAGHNGLVGSAFMRELTTRGYTNLLTASHDELDLTDKVATSIFFEKNKPNYVILAAAKVGGIGTNPKYPVEFLLNNVEIQNNVIRSCYQHSVKKLVFLGSSCIYPTKCKQPIKEDYFMTGALEPTNEGYAIAKITGLRLAQYYNQEYGMDVLNVMPCNLYGKNDSFDPENSHVLSATVRKFVDAKDNEAEEVVMWGTGVARREFLNVEDAVRAILLLVDKWKTPDIVNIGSGKEISIKGLAGLVARIVKYEGNIIWDNTKPDGMLRKCLDVSKLNSLGYEPQITLSEGVEQMVEEYRERKKNGTL